MSKLTVLLAVGGLAVIGFGLERFHSAVMGASNRRARRPSAEEASSTQELGRLAGAVESLNRRVNGLSAELGRTSQDVAKTDCAITEPARRGATHSEPDGEVAAEDGLGRDRQPNWSSIREKVQTCDDAFAAEPYDREWASDMKGLIGESMDRGEYGSTRVLSSDCRATACRLQVAHDDVESSSAFEAIVRAVPGSYYLQHLEANEDGRSETVVYFIREGRESDSAVFQSVVL